MMRAVSDKNTKKSKKSIFNSESAAATVIAAVLLLSIIFSTFAVIRIAYVPEWKNDAEKLHMGEVQRDMIELKSTIDRIAFLTAPNESSFPLPVTVPFSMGGGEIPILEPSRSSGTLSVSTDDFEMIIVPKNFSGEYLPRTVIRGGITFSSNNRQYIDQIFRYENGALILDQSGRSVMKQPPSFNIVNNSQHYNIFLQAINITGNNAALSSNNDAFLSLNGGRSTIPPYSAKIDSFDCIISTKYPDAWKSYLNENLNETAKNAGLIYGTDYYISPYDSPEINFTFAFIGGKELDGLYISQSDIKAELGVGTSFTSTNYGSEVPGSEVPGSGTPGSGTVKQPPISGFSFYPQSGCVPVDIQITDTSQKATTYKYDFGDETPLTTEKNPTHTYKKSGTFKITQTVTNLFGTDTKVNPITIRHMPIANFSSDVTEGEIPLTVNFIDSSQYATSEVTWNFGDGSETEAGSNVTHTYTGPGTYNVTLTASNGFENNTTTGKIFAKQMPKAEFAASPLSGQAPLFVTFTDLSANANEWVWNFGDESFSNEQSPIHNFSSVGTYNVTLAAINEYGQDTKTRAITVRPAPPVANFTVSSVNGRALVNVTFIDTSTGSPTTWTWSFGDNTYSIEQNPVHIYNRAGKYTILLTVGNEAGTDMASKTIMLT